MAGRDSVQGNNLFFVCSVIEQIGRVTKNRRSDVVRKLGVASIGKLLDLADVLHSEPLDATAQDLISRHSIETGTFENNRPHDIKEPSVFDIAKVYKRLIADVASKRGQDTTATLIEVYTSWISAKIDDFSSSLFFENPDYLLKSYILGEPIRDSHSIV